MTGTLKEAAEQERLGREADLERRLRSAVSARDRALGDLAEARRALNFITSVEQQKLRPPRWLTPKAPVRGHRATLNLLITDTHFAALGPISVRM